jgi:hypothetical protein
MSDPIATMVNAKLFFIALSIFAVLVLLSAVPIALPKPADWLEAWVKLFGTVVAIVGALKIASDVADLRKSLAAKVNRE